MMLLPREIEGVAMGLEAEADDCLLIPCDTEEFKARVRLGQRILQIRRELFHKFVMTRSQNCQIVPSSLSS
jgi:DNA-binding response OmpR family regulator